MSDNTPNKANTVKVDHLKKFRIIVQQLGVVAYNQIASSNHAVPELEDESPKSTEKKQPAVVFKPTESIQKPYSATHANEEQSAVEEVKVPKSDGLLNIRLYNNQPQAADNNTAKHDEPQIPQSPGRIPAPDVFHHHPQA